MFIKDFCNYRFVANFICLGRTTSNNFINANLVDKSLILQKYPNRSKYIVMILKFLLLVEYLV